MSSSNGAYFLVVFRRVSAVYYLVYHLVLELLVELPITYVGTDLRVT